VYEIWHDIVKIPNLFVVGAPKCGTSSLHAWLSGHPDVFMCSKEPEYFGRDLNYRHRRLTLDQYRGLFNPTGDQLVIGDASVWYLYSRLAAEEIKAFSPDARVVALVRNPVEVMHSLHSQALFTADEELANFEDALNAEGDRRMGLRIPRTCRVPHALLYREVVLFSEQLRRYLTVFGKERVAVIVFDDLATDPALTYRRILKFLDVDETYDPALDIVNSNRIARSAALNRFFRQPPELLRRIGRSSVRSSSLRRAMGGLLVDLNTSRRPRAPLDPLLRAKLQEEFAPEVEELGRLLGRDLTAWSAG
jgi:hypothetical protein